MFFKEKWEGEEKSLYFYFFKHWKFMGDGVLWWRVEGAQSFEDLGQWRLKQQPINPPSLKNNLQQCTSILQTFVKRSSLQNKTQICMLV